MEFLGAAAPSFSMTLSNSTTVQVVAGTGDDQVGVAIDGRWRYRSTSTTAAHPGGAAGTYDVFVCGSDNSFALGTPTVDNTTYAFTVEIKAQGNTPSTAIHRKIGEVDWDGAAITALRVLGGTRRDDAPIVPTAPLATITPLRVRAAASQSAALAIFQNSAGSALATISAGGALTISGQAQATNAVLTNSGKTALALTSTGADTGLTLGGDVTLYRSAADVLKTDDALTVAGILTASGTGKTAVTISDSGAQSSGLTIGGDTNLYRSGADVLKTDDSLEVALSATISGHLTLGASSVITIGTTNSVNLYRSAADTLKTDDAMIVAGDLTVQGNLFTQGGSGSAQSVLSLSGTGKTVLSFSDTTTTTGLTVGADTNLYRNAANTWRTDDVLTFAANSAAVLQTEQVAANVAFQQKLLAADTNAAFRILGDGKVQWGAGGASAVDTVLYRSAADVLKTDDSLHVAATFSHLGSSLGFFNASPTTKPNATSDIKDSLVILGLITDGGATPLNLDGGALTAASASLTGAGTGLAVTNNATVGGTLGVTGTSTLAAISASGQVSLSYAGTALSLGASSNASFGGTIGVTGTSTLATVNASGVLTLSYSGNALVLNAGSNASFNGTLAFATAITGNLIAARQVAGQSVLVNSLLGSDTYPAFRLFGDGKIEWGAGGASALDTNLYRSAANVLKTDDGLTVMGYLTASGTGKTAIQISDSGAQDSGLTIGGDTNLYRNGADSLKTDDAFTAAGTLTAGNGLTVSAGAVSIAPSAQSVAIANSNGTLGFFGQAAASQRTGWGSFTLSTGSAAGARRTLAQAYTTDQLVEVVATIVTDLKTLGLLAA